MEIALLPKNAVKVKGKYTVLVVDPVDASTAHQASLFLRDEGHVSEDAVPISGPGEYEVGGVKISGVKSTEGIVYSLNVDDIDILIGSLQAIEKLQHKMKEHNLVLLHAGQEIDASFVTSLATNSILLYGEKAREVMGKFAKEGMNEMGKYQVTKDKLPLEIQTVLLQ